MSVPPIVLTDQGEVVRYFITRFDTLEATLMATKAETEQALADLSASIADYTSDVTKALAQLSAAQADMQTTLDRLTVDDAADKALIDDLRAQLDAQVGITDTVVARAANLTQAVRQADVAVDQPEQPAP